MNELSLLFSLSKSKGDFVVQPFKGSGKGGQKRNKTMSACRIIHPDSGAVAECQEERSFEQNKKKAFIRLINSCQFKQWHKIQINKKLGILAAIDEKVESEMKNIKVEVMKDGKWVELKKEKSKRENE